MKILICDPVCVQEHGHNLTAAVRYGYFLNEIISRKKDIKILVGNNLDVNKINWLNNGLDIKGFFTHYYPDLLPIKGIKSKVDKDHGEKISKIAYEELCGIIENYIGNSEGVVYYPSIDYFSLKSIIEFIKNNKEKELKIHFVLRFIGVMEFHNYECSQSFDDLLLELNDIKDTHLIKLSAKSNIFAEYITNKTAMDVVITPTLVNGEVLKYPNNNIFTIAFPGSARRDKGFDRIPAILDWLDQKYPDMQYRVLLQSLAGKELEYFSEYLFALNKKSNVIVYPSSLSYEKMKELTLFADLVVAPYDSNVYKYRSSAIMANLLFMDVL